MTLFSYLFFFTPSYTAINFVCFRRVFHWLEVSKFYNHFISLVWVFKVNFIFWGRMFILICLSYLLSISNYSMSNLGYLLVLGIFVFGMGFCRGYFLLQGFRVRKFYFSVYYVHLLYVRYFLLVFFFINF